MHEYHSIAALIDRAELAGTSISAIVARDQADVLETTPDAVREKMAGMLAVMRDSAETGMDPYIRSTSGLTGGEASLMRHYAGYGEPIGGDFCATAIATALAVSSSNAAMGKIVAAPTAGSCGILPGAVLTMMSVRNATEQQAVDALITAGAIGVVIATQASISGAEGGCQAECGSAAAMAAGALVEMMGGRPVMVGHAVAIALKNQLGLVCDPVAGLVEIPCIKRNAGGIMCAIAAADMALAGIDSLIPVDEVITAMRDIGDSMPKALRETALGGLAATPTGIAIKQRVFGPPGGEEG